MGETAATQVLQASGAFGKRARRWVEGLVVTESAGRERLASDLESQVTGSGPPGHFMVGGSALTTLRFGQWTMTRLLILKVRILRQPTTIKNLPSRTSSPIAKSLLGQGRAVRPHSVISWTKCLSSSVRTGILRLNRNPPHLQLPPRIERIARGWTFLLVGTKVARSSGSRLLQNTLQQSNKLLPRSRDSE